MAKKYNIPYVYVANGRVVYRPRITKKLQELNLNQDSRGFLKPPIKLGLKGDSEDKIMQAYLLAKESLHHENNTNKCRLGYISEKYQQSSDFISKSPKTQKEYELNANKVLSYPLKIEGKSDSLSNLLVQELTKPLMNALREKQLIKYQEEGKKGTVAINRQVSYLSTIISWGLNTIPELPKIQNPLIGIKRFKEEANQRYVTDKEIAIQCKIAAEVRDYLPPLIRLSFLLGTRGIETINLKHSDLLDEGIDISRTKKSKDNVIAWSDALIEEVNNAKALVRNTSSVPIDPYLLTNLSGQPITQSAVQSAMRVLKKKMIEKGLEHVYFRLHLTKSKAQSDSEDDDISGLSEPMKRRYTTKKKVIKTGLK